MKLSNLHKAVWLLFLLPLFTACNNTDDVAGIFTGKTWKLNYITADGQHEMFDFWDKNAEARKKSLDKLNADGTFFIRFDGAADGDIITGKLSGKTIATNLNGTWSANGKNNNFKAAVEGSSEGDLLAKNFLEGLNAATSYEGDDKNLYILYQAGQQTFRIVFRLVNSK